MLIEEYKGKSKTRVATVQVFLGSQSRVFVLWRKLNQWHYSPMNETGDWDFDLREWKNDPKPLYKMYLGQPVFPIMGFAEKTKPR